MPILRNIAPSIADVLAKQREPTMHDLFIWATLVGNEASARLFLPGGRVPREGERLRNPQLAATLR